MQALKYSLVSYLPINVAVEIGKRRSKVEKDN